MKKLLILLIPAFCYSTVMAQQKDIDAIKKLNANWIASYVTKDTATLSRIYADDIQLTNPSGKLMHKPEMLKSAASQDYVSTKVDTATVRLFGDIGIINAEITAITKGEGKNSTFRIGYMDVYQKRKGRWYAIAAHVTLLSSN